MQGGLLGQGLGAGSELCWGARQCPHRLYQSAVPRKPSICLQFKGAGASPALKRFVSRKLFLLPARRLRLLAHGSLEPALYDEVEELVT